MVKTLGELADELFQQVGVPEPTKREIPASLEVLRSIGQPEGWAASEVGYAAPFETGDHLSRVWRIGRAWQDSPPAVEFGSIDGHNHQLPYGVVGSHNVGLAPVVACYLQELRKGDVNPNNPHDVKAFQQNMASLVEITLPLLLGRILRETSFGKTQVHYEFRGLPIETRDYGELWSSQPLGHSPLSSNVRTMSGSLSVAAVAPLLAVRGVEHHIKPKMDLPEVSLIAIHRAGILPSLMGQYVANMFGMRSYLVGVEAKRQHDTSGITAKLSAPYGHQPTAASTLSGGFLFPDGFPFNGQVEGKRMKHIVFDPMLATGKSAEVVIRGYQEVTGAPSSDITVVSIFAGGYEGIQRLRELGVNILLLQHDQADLNSSGYIQPGLGDAGDKLCGFERDTGIILREMSHLTKRRPGLGKLFEAYSRQVTGKGVT